MKNSLRIILREKGLKQTDLAELTGYDFRTVSQYVRSDDDLPEAFLKKAAEALKVNEQRIAEEPADNLSEEAPEYRAQAIPLGAMETPLLEYVLKALNGSWMNAPEPRRGLALGAMVTINQELRQRGQAPATPVSSTPASGEEGILDAAAEPDRPTRSRPPGSKR